MFKQQGITLTYIGSFGWKEQQDPEKNANDSTLLRHFRSRLEVPGEPPRLPSSYPTSLVLQTQRNERKCAKYDRPPIPAILMAANDNNRSFNLHSVDFVTPRRNLLKMSSIGKQDSLVNVQRFARGPIFIDRVITYDTVDKGDVGHLFERQMVEPKKHSDQFRLLVVSQVGEHKILMSGEADCVTSQFSETKRDESQLAYVRELKSIWANNSRLLAERTPGWWLQAHMVGTERMLVGMKSSSRGSSVVRLDVNEMRTEDLLGASEKRKYVQEMLLTLDWLKASIPSDGKVYRVDLAGRSISREPQVGQSIITQDMLDEIFGPRKTMTSSS